MICQTETSLMVQTQVGIIHVVFTRSFMFLRLMSPQHSVPFVTKGTLSSKMGINGKHFLREGATSVPLRPRGQCFILSHSHGRESMSLRGVRFPLFAPCAFRADALRKGSVDSSGDELFQTFHRFRRQFELLSFGLAQVKLLLDDTKNTEPVLQFTDRGIIQNVCRIDGEGLCDPQGLDVIQECEKESFLALLERRAAPRGLLRLILNLIRIRQWPSDFEREGACVGDPLGVPEHRLVKMRYVPGTGFIRGSRRRWRANRTRRMGVRIRTKRKGVRSMVLVLCLPKITCLLSPRFGFRRPAVDGERIARPFLFAQKQYGGVEYN
jgi:hypothetical protein